MPVQYFGDKWDAPVTDNAVLIQTPTEAQCMICSENFVEGDQGIRLLSGFYEHKECGLRSAMGGIGHLVDHAYFCSGELGTDAGLSCRESSKLVWEWFVNGKRFTRVELERYHR